MTQFSANDPIVILSYARTPMGGMQGVLADVSATDLGATAVKAAVVQTWRKPVVQTQQPFQRHWPVLKAG